MTAIERDRAKGSCNCEQMCSIKFVDEMISVLRQSWPNGGNQVVVQGLPCHLSVPKCNSQ